METRERLHHLRKNLLNITQDEFCSNINIKRSTLSNIEKGRIALTERTINDICRVYNVSKDWLVCGVEPVFVVADNRAYSELEAIYTKLEPKYRVHADEYLELLLKAQRTALKEVMELKAAAAKDVEAVRQAAEEKAKIIIEDARRRASSIIRTSQEEADLEAQTIKEQALAEARTIVRNARVEASTLRRESAKESSFGKLSAIMAARVSARK